MFSLAAIRSLDVSDPLPDIANDMHVRATDRRLAENVFGRQRALHLSAFETGDHRPPNENGAPCGEAEVPWFLRQVNEVDC